MAHKAFFYDRVVGKTLKLEGGHTVNPNDTGNWTGGAIGEGELKGTKYGISAASYPNLDIKNLTKEQAARIYYEDYWLAGGCDELPSALAFLHFDSIVQHGSGNASRFLLDSDGSLWSYYAIRLRFYADLKQFFQDDGDPSNDFGRGWTRRMAAMAREIAEIEGAKPERNWKLVVQQGNSVHPIDIPQHADLLMRLDPDRDRFYLTVKEGDFDV